QVLAGGRLPGAAVRAAAAGLLVGHDHVAIDRARGGVGAGIVVGGAGAGQDAQRAGVARGAQLLGDALLGERRAHRQSSPVSTEAAEWVSAPMLIASTPSLASTGMRC